MKPIQFHPWPIALLLAGVLLWVGCEAAKYREAADGLRERRAKWSRARTNGLFYGNGSSHFA